LTDSIAGLLPAEKLLGDHSQKLDVRIKWPNDLYAGPHKLAGILCHSVYRDKQFQVLCAVILRIVATIPRATHKSSSCNTCCQVVIGVGLNVSNEQPSTCINALLREEQRRSNPELTSGPAVNPEVTVVDPVLMNDVHTLRIRCVTVAAKHQEYRRRLCGCRLCWPQH
jgi:biotin-(acetyl-CoA carboxylase) ligase